MNGEEVQLLTQLWQLGMFVGAGLAQHTAKGAARIVVPGLLTHFLTCVHSTLVISYASTCALTYLCEVREDVYSAAFGDTSHTAL
jgi:hypothetical protein